MGRLFFRIFFSVLLAVFIAALVGALVLLLIYPEMAQKLSELMQTESTSMASDSHIRSHPSLGYTLLRVGPTIVSLTIVSYILARRLAKPMETLRAGIRRFAAGDLEYRAAPEIGRRKDEIGELAQEFDRMAARIEGLVTTQRRLLRDISHELRSPLARQRVAIELLSDRLDDDKASETLARIEREAGRLDALIDELLTLARLESGDHPDIKTEPLDLCKIVNEIADDANFEAQRAGKSVRLAEFENCRTVGSAKLLQHALENVVRNAIRHTADGTEVTVRLRADDASILIRVRDHGPGVPADKLDDIFKPFFRIDAARERNVGGAGIGLSIVDRAIRYHHGRVWANNVDGGGLEISIQLPKLNAATPLTNDIID